MMCNVETRMWYITIELHICIYTFICATCVHNAFVVCGCVGAGVLARTTSSLSSYLCTALNKLSMSIIGFAGVRFLGIHKSGISILHQCGWHCSTLKAKDWKLKIVGNHIPRKNDPDHLKLVFQNTKRYSFTKLFSDVVFQDMFFLHFSALKVQELLIDTNGFSRHLWTSLGPQ